MKYFKKFFNFFGMFLIIILIVIIGDYIRLNLNYVITKNKYTDSIKILGNKNHYTPQGLTYSKKYDVILQTSYNSKHDVSMLYVTSLTTHKLLKSLKLKEIDNTDNVNHVGGLTINNDKVYITNDYEINEYSMKEIIKTKRNYIKSKKNSKIPNRGDFCSYNNNNILWIGDFFLNPFYKVPNNKPLLIGYDATKEINYERPNYIIALPKMVQGLTITEDNKFIMTKSFTNLIMSDLSIYDNILNNSNTYYKLNKRKVPYYKIKKDNLIANYKLPPMAEGLFYKDKELYILFENSSDTYFYAYPKIKKITIFSPKELVN